MTLSGLSRGFAAAVASAAAVAVCVSTAPAAAADPEAPDRPARVMTFNIHHGVGTDGRLDLERVAGTIRSEEPDVVGLQEVDRHYSERSDFVDQAASLAGTLHMHVVFGANLDLDPEAPGQPRRQYGTAILSRWPILEWSNTYLPRYDDHEQRGLLYARVAVRGVAVRVYDTHLQQNTPPEQLAQAEAIRSLIGTPDESVVLLGDLNGIPETAQVRALAEDLVDTWVAAGVGEGYTFHSDDPTTRIDYVLASDDVVVRTAAVVTSDASDHLPVATDIALPGQKVGIGH